MRNEPSHGKAHRRLTYSLSTRMTLVLLAGAAFAVFSEDPEVGARRAENAFAALSLPSEAAIPKLIRSIQDDQPRGTRSLAIHALHAVGRKGPAVEAALIDVPTVKRGGTGPGESGLRSPTCRPR